MPWKTTITLDDAITYLNSLIEADQEAIQAIIDHRVPCNATLADHPTAQVLAEGSGHVLGALGVLNGLFGVDDVGWGALAACYDDDEKLVSFQRTDNTNIRRCDPSQNLHDKKED